MAAEISVYFHSPARRRRRSKSLTTREKTVLHRFKFCQRVFCRNVGMEHHHGFGTQAF